MYQGTLSLKLALISLIPRLDFAWEINMYFMEFSFLFPGNKQCIKDKRKRGEERGSKNRGAKKASRLEMELSGWALIQRAWDPGYNNQYTQREKGEEKKRRGRKRRRTTQKFQDDPTSSLSPDLTPSLPDSFNGRCVGVIKSKVTSSKL